MPESETWDANHLTSRERHDLTLSRTATASSGPVQAHKVLLQAGAHVSSSSPAFPRIAGLESSCGFSLALTLQVPLFLVSKSHDLNVTGAVWVLVCLF